MNVKDILSKELHQQEELHRQEAFFFPYEIFPTELQNLINNLHQSLKYPKDYTAGALLFATSVIVGNSLTIELKGGYTEKANIYLINVGNAGANKTRPFKDILKLIRKKDIEARERYKRLLKEYNDDNTKPKPKDINYLLNDFTPEYLIKSLSEHSRGVSIFVDEILAWLKNLDKYSRGSSLEFYLSLWNGLSVKVGRATQETIAVNNPFVSIAGTIQPTRLIKEFKDKEDNGFLDRFLFIYPAPEKKYLTDEPINKAFLSEWELLATYLYNALPYEDEEDNKVIKCNDEARRLLIDWINQHQGDDEDEVIISLYQKLHSYALRLTLLVYAIEWITGGNDTGQITKETAEKGIQLVEYFKETALKVRAEMYSNKTYLDTINHDKRQLYDALNETFSTNEATARAEMLKLSEKTARRFISDKRLFKKIQHGIYKKI